MDKQTRLEEAAEAKTKGDVVRVEQIYHEILSKDAGNNESALREQEVALIQLGELYRDQKFVLREKSCILTSVTGMSINSLNSSRLLEQSCQTSQKPKLPRLVNSRCPRC
jgi:hypothetical protein